MNTIKVPGTGKVEDRLRDVEQAINYGEVVLPFNIGDGGGGTVTQALSGVWNYKATGGMTDPGTGNLAPDVVGAPTIMRFSTYTVDGTDTRNIFLTMAVGDILVVQQKTDATKWAKEQVRAPVVDHGTWFEVPITTLAGGTGGALANNADVAVQVQRGTGTAGPRGPAGGGQHGH